MRRSVLLLALLASCSPQTSTTNQQPPTPATPPATTAVATITSTSAAALDAKHIVERYFDLIKSRKFSEARLLWDHDGADSGGDAAALAASFARFTTYAPTVGDPTEVRIKDGLQYVAVAVKAKVTDKQTSRVYVRDGSLLLRRAAGPAASLKEWRIWGMDLREKH